jgi:pyridoxamine 5'-phosphate oxidase
VVYEQPEIIDMKQPLAAMRRDYSLAELSTESVDTDPIRQFERWFEEARNAEVLEPNAMSLATADNHGIPSVRVVLLKDFDQAGFVFYTNYQSDKARELAQNPHAAVVFLWRELERQVRISGSVEKVPAAMSQAYFRSRPRGSQIGALASDQSRVVASRQLLDQRFQAIGEQYKETDIPMPEHWGGYRLIPQQLEFWQGRASRLHDRLRYRRSAEGWLLERLEP